MMMSNEINDETSAKQNDPAPAGRAPARRWFGIPVAAGLLAVGVGTAGVVATQAFGHGKDFGGWRGHGRMEAPAARGQNIERGIRHLAVEIDATDEQQKALVELARSTVKDLHEFRDMMQGDAGELVGLLTGATVDRAAIEAFRSEKMAKLDQLTSQLVDVATQAGEILTPEQRTKIAELVAEHRERGGMRRGRKH
jgi:Spy/CpxP family protein refolding chaperone